MQLPFASNIVSVKQSLKFDVVSLATQSRWEQASGKGVYNCVETFEVEYVGLSDAQVAEFEAYLQDPSIVYLYSPPALYSEHSFKAVNGWQVTRGLVVAPRGLVGCEVNPYGLPPRPTEHIGARGTVQTQYQNKLSINLVKLSYLDHIAP